MKGNERGSTMTIRPELAYNEHGKRFSVSDEAVAWLTRRFSRPGKRGGCELVYGDDGTPLLIDIEADTTDFRSAVHGVPGRYRLDAVDQEGNAVPDVPPAYLVITDAKPVSRADEPPATTSSTEWALVEAVRANSAALATMSANITVMVQAAGGLLDAADRSGFTKRLPTPAPVVVANEQDEDEDEAEQDGAARQGSDVFSVVSQLVAMVQKLQTMGTPSPTPPSTSTREPDPAAPHGGYEDVEDVEEVEPERPIASSARRAPTASAARSAPTAKRDSGQHFRDIQARLTDEERAFLQRAITKLPMGELLKWRDQLAQLSVDQAVALLRAEMAGQSGSTEAKAS
jgi:hypothetical protein